MKKTLKFLMPLLLGLLIIASIFWYLFIYDRNFTRDTLLHQARYQDMNGNTRISSWFYDAAYRFSGHDENVAIELANQYKQDGNYTKAELTLTEAIYSAPTAELYTALSRVYVEQDKLLDAIHLLDTIPHPEIKAQLDAQRPISPVPGIPAGFYSEYINVALESKAKYIFYTVDKSYPSIQGLVYQGPVAIPAGETILTAIAVSEDGLVSPIAELCYTINGVIEEVVFQDTAIDTAIRTMIGADADDLILSNQLWDISEFKIPENAKTFEDLAHLVNLKKLSINEHNLESLEFLSPLQKLAVLDLSGSRFDPRDLEVVTTLPALEELLLSGCSLSSIEHLENAVQLTALDLSSNTIRNLDVLASMPKLSKLNLQHNAVNSLAIAANLTNLTELHIGYNDITDLSPLTNCQNLAYLDADHNKLESLDGLYGLTKLEYLSVDYNSIADISYLASNTSLKNLSIASNKISNISALGALSKLEILDFSGNHVEALPTWSDSCPLQTIDGSYNALTSIDELRNLQSLTHVYMDYNLITNIDALENCFCLVQVNAFGNAIPDVSVLRNRDIIVNYDPTVEGDDTAEEESEDSE